MTDKENKWIKFYPSLELPKERVSIAYATHDEREYRFAYGYFQFHNGTCSSFWKDGNEQPKAVKVDDIKYWMPVPSLDSMQEEPTIPDIVDEHFDEMLGEELVSEDLEKAAKECCFNLQLQEYFKKGAYWKEQQFEKNWLEACYSQTEEEMKIEHDLVMSIIEKEHRQPTLDDAIKYGMMLQKEQMMKKAVNGTFSFGELADGTPIDSIFVLDKEARSKYKEGDKVKLIIIKEG